MKRANDCILENSLKFKIYGECYSAEDIYIQNQETLSIVSDLIGRIKTLEKLIEPPRTVYRTIWVDKKVMAYFIEQPPLKRNQDQVGLN